MPHINCPSAYIGESGRSLGEKVKEHSKAPSPIHHYSATTGYPMDPDQFNIVHKKLTAIPGPSRRPCSPMCRTPPSTETWENTSCCTYGTTSSRHLPLFSTSPQTSQPHQQILNTPPFWFPHLFTHSSHCPLWQGAQTFSYGKYPCMSQLPPSPYLQQVLQQHHLGKFLTFYSLG